jgi:hypothetical protein
MSFSVLCTMGGSHHRFRIRYPRVSRRAIYCPMSLSQPSTTSPPPPSISIHPPPLVDNQRERVGPPNKYSSYLQHMGGRGVYTLVIIINHHYFHTLFSEKIQISDFPDSTGVTAITSKIQTVSRFDCLALPSGRDPAEKVGSNHRWYVFTWGRSLVRLLLACNYV